MSNVFLNGNFVDAADARVSAFDAGFQHGVGLFETMLAINTADGVRIVDADEHVQRLVDSARTLNLSDSLRAPALVETIERTVSKAGVARARVRLTVTGGDLNMLARDLQSPGNQARHDPTVLISVQPATQYPDEMFSRGVRVTVADLRVNPLDPFQGHKTLNYWPRLRELQRAAAKQSAEALVFQVTNYLAGGCVSNAILVKDGKMITPIARGEELEVADAKGEATDGAVVPSPVLPGIVRARVLRWADEHEIEVVRRMVSIEDVLSADELFLTNSSWGVLPVTQLEAKPIGDGKVGRVTGELIEAWQEHAGTD
jgi:branched-subunit amino acid aminotransferase/4-amino-4-deoxychorismate lyase